MSIEPGTATASPIELGTVYTVAWNDHADAAVQERFTPRSGQPARRDSDSRAWLMIGARLRRFRDYIIARGCSADVLVYEPWTDLADIADRFAKTLGFPGRACFEPGNKCIAVTGHEYGGVVSLIEAEHNGGVPVSVLPLHIGEGWIGLVAHMSPVERVLAIPLKAVATITANMLGSSVRRTRIEALLFLAEEATARYSSFWSLLGQRKASRGKDDIGARVSRLGEMVHREAALPCRSLFDFAEHGGKAAVSIAPVDDHVLLRTMDDGPGERH